MGCPNILHFITLSEHGGAQSVCAQTVLGLQQHGYSVAVACGAGDWLVQYLQQRGVRVIHLPAMKRAISPTQDLKILSEVYNLIRDEGFHLLHCHSTKAGLLGRLAASLAGVPAVFTAHGWAFSEGVPKRRRQFAVLMERLVAATSAKIICVSDYDYRLALCYRLTSPECLTVIHNGIDDIEPCLIADPSRGNPVRIVMVARFSAPKKHRDLLTVASKLTGDFVVSFVGSGPLLETCTVQTQALGLGHKVQFLGERDDVSEILSRANLFVLSSDWEGLPISILEAMRAGLPVVVSAVGGVPELVQDGVNGCLVARGDVHGLAHAVQRLIDDPALRKRMGENSRASYLSGFTERRMIDETLAVYEAVLSRHK